MKHSQKYIQYKVSDAASAKYSTIPARVHFNAFINIYLSTYNTIFIIISWCWEWRRYSLLCWGWLYLKVREGSESLRTCWHVLLSVSADKRRRRRRGGPLAEKWTGANITQTLILQHSCSGRSRTWAASCAAGPVDTTPSPCPRCWPCRGGGHHTSTSGWSRHERRLLDLKCWRAYRRGIKVQREQHAVNKPDDGLARLGKCDLSHWFQIPGAP